MYIKTLATRFQCCAYLLIESSSQRGQRRRRRREGDEAITVLVPVLQDLLCRAIEGIILAALPHLILTTVSVSHIRTIVPRAYDSLLDNRGENILCAETILKGCTSLKGIAFPQRLIQIVATRKVIEPSRRKTPIRAQAQYCGLSLRKPEKQAKKSQVQTQE